MAKLDTARNFHLLTAAESKTAASEYPRDVNAPECGIVAVVDGPLSGDAESVSWDVEAYTCTRPVGHDGPHVAHAPRGPIASWES